MTRGIAGTVRSVRMTRFASVLLWGSVAAACADRDSDVTLRFWAMGREGEVVQQLIPEFERRNPGVRVRVQQMPWTAAHEKLLTAYVGEATPDVSQLGNTWVPEFVALDALESLDPWLARSAALRPADFFPGIWDTNVLADSAYGIPWYVDTRLLFYRKDILARAGYSTVPDSWAGWREAMVHIKSRMKEGEYPILLPTNEWNQPIIFGLQSDATLLREGDRYGAFSDPRYRGAFAFYVQLFRDGLAPILGLQQIANLYEDFAAGRIAMYISGPWQIGEFSRRLPANMQDKWATAPLPGPDSATPGVSLAGGSSLVIFRESEHKAEAWKLIEYLSEPAQQLRFYELTGDLPAHRKAWEDSALATNRYARAFREQLERVRATPKIPEWERIATKVFERAETAIRGGVPIDDALKELDREVDRILEKRRWLLAQREARAASGPSE